MRLVDYDADEAYLLDGKYKVNAYIRSKSMSDYIKREDAIKQSADVVEVRHGKWSHDYIKDGVEYDDWLNLHCTVCGETQRDAWGKWNYCPYCGAKMDEEEQENE